MLTTAALDERLQSRLHFSLDDLNANRENRLTDHQRLLVRSKQRAYVHNGSIALGVMWAIFVALMIGSVIGQGAKPEDMRVLPYVLLAMTIIFALVLLFSRLYARDLMAGRISSVEGRADPREVQYQSRYSRGISYQLRIGGRRFLMVSKLELSAFETGARYRVYYIRYAPLHVLLSAEALAISDR